MTKPDSVAPPDQPASAIAEMILDHFNVADNQIEALQARVDGASSHRMKYVSSFKEYIQRNVDRAVNLGLPQCQGKRILDIGAGCCFFPAVAQYFGHRPYATDADLDTVIFKEVRSLLKQSVESLQIHPFEKLPEDLVDFDMITGFATCFNIKESVCGEIECWGAPEWQFFISDVRDRLVAGGRMVFEINLDGTTPDGIAPQVAQELRMTEGARLENIGGYVRFTLDK